ncbi:MAG: lamin tail domain-containing protein [Flavobacteriales bacterium]
MKRLLLLSFTAITSFGAIAQDCSEIFISEYVEGSGNNKAIELYNPTDAVVSLSSYQMGRFRDGSGTPMLVQLNGTIPAFGTYVVALDKRNPTGTGNEEPIDAALEAAADTFVNPVYVQASSPFYFNGDDAFGLFKGDGTVLVDLFGKIGEDPGTAWSDENGTWWSNDHTLIRKPTVLSGVVANPGTFLVQAEWDSLPENTFSELGAHICDCQTLGVEDAEAVQFSMYPNPAVEKELSINASQNLKTIQVFNILGQEADKVSFDKKNTKSHKLILDHLRTGIYIVRVSLDNGAILSRKVMLGK